MKSLGEKRFYLFLILGILILTVLNSLLVMLKVIPEPFKFRNLVAIYSVMLIFATIYSWFKYDKKNFYTMLVLTILVTAFAFICYILKL